MQTETKSIYNLVEDIIKGGLRSAYVKAPFNKGLEVLQAHDYDLISLEQNARLRWQEGAQADIFRYGNWVREDVIYVPKKGTFLTKVSHILRNAEKATECHRNGGDFYLTSEQVDECFTNSVPLITEAISTNKFGDNKIAQYAFGEHAENYGRFLKEYGIEEMPIWLANMQDRPFARKMWFRRLGYGWSGLRCGGWGLFGDGDGVRGVRANDAEGVA